MSIRECKVKEIARLRVKLITLYKRGPSCRNLWLREELDNFLATYSDFDLHWNGKKWESAIVEDESLPFWKFAIKVCP
jgi:hypothetical protein